MMILVGPRLFCVPAAAGRDIDLAADDGLDALGARADKTR